MDHLFSAAMDRIWDNSVGSSGARGSNASGGFQDLFGAASAFSLFILSEPCDPVSTGFSFSACFSKHVRADRFDGSHHGPPSFSCLVSDGSVPLSFSLSGKIDSFTFVSFDWRFGTQECRSSLCTLPSDPLSLTFFQFLAMLLSKLGTLYLLPAIPLLGTYALLRSRGLPHLTRRPARYARTIRRMMDFSYVSVPRMLLRP